MKANKLNLRETRAALKEIGFRYIGRRDSWQDDKKFSYCLALVVAQDKGTDKFVVVNVGGPGRYLQELPCALYDLVELCRKRRARWAA